QMALLLAEMRLVFHGMSGVREFHEPYLAGNARIYELLESGDRAAAADAVVEYLGEAEEHLLAGYPEGSFEGAYSPSPCRPLDPERSITAAVPDRRHRRCAGNR